MIAARRTEIADDVIVARVSETNVSAYIRSGNACLVKGSGRRTLPHLTKSSIKRRTEVDDQRTSDIVVNSSVCAVTRVSMGLSRGSSRVVNVTHHLFAMPPFFSASQAGGVTARRHSATVGCVRQLPIDM